MTFEDTLVAIHGKITAKLFGPDGSLKQVEISHNLQTTNGDGYVANAVVAASQTAMAGMKLGTATTAATKTGAGSFIAVGDYVSGSAMAFDATFPRIAGSANIARFQVTWGAGVATNSNINRVGIVNNTTDAGEADATATLATSVFSGLINKQAGDSLVVTWDITYTGS